MRKITLSRNTKETQIEIALNLDGQRNIAIDTKVPFLDHMLSLMAFHGDFDLKINAQGDIEVDDHHTVEDIGLLLGDCLNQIITKNKGLKRYSEITLPMDESLARVVIDLSNRPYLGYRVPLIRERIGSMETQNIKEFFKALSANARMTLHIDLLFGENEHHKIEAIFKAFGKALSEALVIAGDAVNSSKGVL